jgi:hypothetical protein
MPRGEKLFRFLACLMLQRFYGSVIICFEHGKVTHIETETGWTWGYRDLAEEMDQERVDVSPRS